LFAVLTAPGPAAQSPPTPPPVPTELEEKIEVRLVTIDVVALDADDATVPDLTKDDLELFVDGKRADIDTFDAYCASGAEADPKSLRFGQWPTPRNLQTGTRRVVLAFDYLHLGGILKTQALQDFQHMFKAKTEVADEELMVVALTGGLRVEQPFTKDREAVVNTLRRMEHDISLWNGNFAHLTETPLFRSLAALVTVLRASPGPKSVVFVSGMSGPDDFYDLDFDLLAAAASDAQVSFYTVDAKGLLATAPASGSRALARLASMTGGRLTRNTNDLTIGYARARRDLGCRYTVGFYDITRRPTSDTRSASIAAGRTWI
jgi:VWFA-related protein